MTSSGRTPLEDVSAVPPSLAGEMAGQPTVEPPGSEAFRASGWRFVRSDADRPGFRAVYRDGTGNLSIEGASVVVRFDDDTDADEIDEVLRTQGLRVQRPLGFVPKGFQVAFEDQPAKGQLLELSERLEQLDCVRYAEPDFVEELGSR